MISTYNCYMLGLKEANVAASSAKRAAIIYARRHLKDREYDTVTVLSPDGRRCTAWFARCRVYRTWRGCFKVLVKSISIKKAKP